ncbi:hypothetical protein M0811_02450 [Anaeramoeba ignava]|uniref:Phospholipase C/D domain-containing protein n=1 Tax=Anaeramoeba ignava TaxID=1746090 RepID=A0A9Q0R5X5_ANAIG|nr:hypothetical protein M0811_02450 [Anaeramoeba ignava]
MFRLISFFLIFSTVFSWAEFTHLSYGCEIINLYDFTSFSSSDNWTACSSTVQHKSFLLGAISPDFFTHFGYLDPSFHCLDYGIFLWNYSQLSYKSNDPNFDAYWFSLGFLSHLAEDEIAHYPFSWLYFSDDRELELAADTNEFLLYKSNPMKRPDIPEGFYDFILKSTNAYVSEIGWWNGFIPPNNSSLQYTVKKMGEFLDAEELLIIANELIYKEEMKEFDYCKRATQDEALADYNLAKNWSENTFIVLFQILQNPPQNCQGSIRKCVQFEFLKDVDVLFQNHGGSIC